MLFFVYLFNRVHLALRAYQELLMTLDMMDKSNNSHLMDSSRVIKSKSNYRFNCLVCLFHPAITSLNIPVVACSQSSDKLLMTLDQ